MAPKYKVTYFNVMALGEPIRYILSHAGKEFEDVRVEKEQWAKLKKDAPFGKMPTLEVDGKTAHQSISICRFLAREFGLAGENNWESLQIDGVVDTIVDLRLADLICFRTIADTMHADEATKAQKKEKLINETLPFYLSRLDEQVQINGGYFVNNKLSWADLHFAATAELFKGGLQVDYIAQYPNLKALAEKVYNLPNIKAWREKRPKTQF